MSTLLKGLTYQVFHMTGMVATHLGSQSESRRITVLLDSLAS